MQEALISLSKSIFSSPLLGDTFRDGYYKTLYDIQCRRGFNPFSTIDSEIVENALTYPWSGANFSDRLWKNKNALMDSLRETLTKGMIRGDNIREMSKNIAEKLNASYSNAERLILTESSHIHNTAELSAYEAAGYEQYEFMASPGKKTCEVCGELDGKRFKLSEKQYGVNFPPIHPRCRCTTIGFDPEDEKEPDEQEKMSYEDWYRKYVGNATKPLTNGGEGGIIKARGLAQQKQFNIFDFDIVDDLPSVECLKKYAADKMGIAYIAGVDKLKNGQQVQEILTSIDGLSQKYNKSFSRISIIDFSNENTIAETLGSELRLNVEYFNRPGALKAVLDEWETFGYIPKGCNVNDYVAKHEYYHLLTQDMIDEPHSKIETLVKRAVNDGCEIISENGRYDCHEFVADLLSAKTLTKSQKKLKDSIMKILETRR